VLLNAFPESNTGPSGATEMASVARDREMTAKRLRKPGAAGTARVRIGRRAVCLAQGTRRLRQDSRWAGARVESGGAACVVQRVLALPAFFEKAMRASR
jgi:hypothetical protein